MKIKTKDKIKYYKMAMGTLLDTDFNKIRTAMQALDWTWDNKLHPPTIDKLKNTVENLMLDTLDKFFETGERRMFSSGGFTIDIEEGYVGLDFKVVESYRLGDYL